jgi:hypothetical protein
MMEYSIEPSTRLVRLKYSGAVSFEEWAATMKAVFGNARYRPGFRFLVDRRLAFAPTTEYVERAVAFARRHRGEVSGSRWALVIAGSGTFGMMQLGQMLAKDLPTESCVFKNVDEAERWLQDPPLRA